MDSEPLQHWRKWCHEKQGKNLPVGSLHAASVEEVNCVVCLRVIVTRMKMSNDELDTNPGPSMVVVSKSVHDAQRRGTLGAGICRQIGDSKIIDEIWVKEYNDLVKVQVDNDSSKAI